MAGPDDDWRRIAHRLIRESTPVLHLQGRGAEGFTFMSLIDCAAVDIPDLADDALQGRCPRAAVHPLSIDEMRDFGSLSPELMRTFGREVPADAGHTVAPVEEDARGNLRFDPGLLGRFVLFDMTAPDAVLVDEFAAWLATERKKLVKFPGVLPYRDGLAKLSGRKTPRLRTLARIGLLPAIDLMQWKSDTKASMTDAFMAELLDIEPDTLRESRRYAKLLLDPWVLDGWLKPLARDTIQRPVARHSPEVSGQKPPC